MRWIFWKLEEHCIITVELGLQVCPPIGCALAHNLCLSLFTSTVPNMTCVWTRTLSGFPRFSFALFGNCQRCSHLYTHVNTSTTFCKFDCWGLRLTFCLIQELKQIKAWNFGRWPFATKLSQNIYSLLNLEEKRVNSRGLGSSVRLCPCTGNLSACLKKTFRASSYSTFASTLFTRQTSIETFIGIISCLEFDVFRGIEWWFLVLPLTNCSVQNNVRLEKSALKGSKGPLWNQFTLQP